MPNNPVRNSPSIAVVGAGASGALLATRLLRSLNGLAATVRLIDPSPTTGQGVAYSTNDWRHRLNVPSKKMSAFPEEPDHFVRWLAARGEDANPIGFAPRGLYGDYLADCLERANRSSSVELIRVHEQVVEIRRGSSVASYGVRCSGSTRFEADWVVLATGSPRSAKSWAPVELIASDHFIADPWQALNSAAVTNASDILLVGAGLTMVDTAISLGRSRAVDAPVRIHVLSRTGILPAAHLPVPNPPLETPQLPAGPLTLDQVRSLVKQQVSLALAASGDWRPGIDSLRPITNNIWARLSPDDQLEFLRTDLRSWDTRRHRMSPQTGQLIDGMIAAGHLIQHTGTVTGCEERSGRVSVEVGDSSTLEVDVVIDCTGPSNVSQHSGTGDMLLAETMAQGLATAHNLSTGLQVDAAGHLIDSAGQAQTRFLAIGPIRKGSEWETTAMPEIRVQAASIAAEIARTVTRRVRRPKSLDLHGLQVSASPQAVDAYNDALGRLLRVQSGVEDALLEALRHDEDFALAHIAMAILEHEYDRPTGALQHLELAEGAVERRGSAREKAFVATMGRRIRGLDPQGNGVVAYLNDFPRDALAVSVAVPTIAFAGIYSVPQDAWELVDRLAPSYGDDWWFTGLLAFIRQEQGRLAEADQLSAKSLSVEPSAGTAVHARAHVFFESGEHRAGLDWLDGWIDGCGRDAVNRAHFSWHAALHEFALGDDDAAWRRYERQLAPPMVSGVRALVDSASLLWRWRVDDVLLEPRIAQAPIRSVDRHDLLRPATPFVAMHSAVAMAVAGDLAGLETLRVHCWHSDNQVMREVSAGVVQALAWFVEGRFADCATLLQGLAPKWHAIAGSDAQREILLDTLIAALIKAGRCADAARMLQQRLDLRPRPRDQRALAAVVRSFVAEAPR